MENDDLLKRIDELRNEVHSLTLRVNAYIDWLRKTENIIKTILADRPNVELTRDSSGRLIVTKIK